MAAKDDSSDSDFWYTLLIIRVPTIFIKCWTINIIISHWSNWNWNKSFYWWIDSQRDIISYIPHLSQSDFHIHSISKNALHIENFNNQYGQGCVSEGCLWHLPHSPTLTPSSFLDLRIKQLFQHCRNLGLKNHLSNIGLSVRSTWPRCPKRHHASICATL